MDDDQIAVLYAKLSYPTAAKFRATLAKRGVKISVKDAQAIASRLGQRQALAPERPYAGRIVSPDLNARWAADLISYIAQRAVVEGRTYRYVLVVQDIFSRKIWTEAMQTKAELLSGSSTPFTVRPHTNESKARRTFLYFPKRCGN